MAEPTPDPQAVADFNAGVDRHIEARAREGITLSRADAIVQFGNLLKNVAENPESVEAQFSVEQRVTEIERRLNAAGVG